MFSQKKPSWFLFLDNLKFKKVSTSLLASLSLSKSKNSKASRLIVGPPFQCYLSLSVWCVCFVYLHHFYQYYCVLLEELSLIASNEQIYTFYKWVIFLKENTLWKVNLWYQWIIQCNTIAAVSTWQVVLIYI